MQNDHHSIPEHFHHTQQSPWAWQWCPPIPPFPQPRINNRLSVSAGTAFNGIIWYVVFCVWLLGILFSMSTHVVAFIDIRSFLMVE